MKKRYIRILAATLLSAAVALLFAACAALSGTDVLPTETPTETPTAAPTKEEEEDEVTLADYDAEATYTMPSFFSLNMEDYVTLGRYRGLTLEVDKADITVTDDEVETLIKSEIQLHDKTQYVTDRVTAWGDTVYIDYEGKLDGVAFSGGSAQNQTVVISEESNYISDFITGLVGLMPGEATDVKVVFPENYGNAELAGKETVFTMTVHFILVVPELDDALAAEFSEDASMTAEAYRTNLRTELETEKYQQAAETALWSAVVENAAVKQYPKEAVLYYYDYYYDMYSYYASLYSMTYENFLLVNGTSPAYLFEFCKELVKEDMVRYAVFAAEQYEVTEAELDAELTAFTEENRQALIDSTGVSYTFAEAKAYFADYLGENLKSNCINAKATGDLLTKNTITAK